MEVRVATTEGDGRGDEEVEECDFFCFAGVSSARPRGPRLPFASLHRALPFGLGLVAFLPGFFFVLPVGRSKNCRKNRLPVGIINLGYLSNISGLGQ